MIGVNPFGQPARFRSSRRPPLNAQQCFVAVPDICVLCKRNYATAVREALRVAGRFFGRTWEVRFRS